jgi:hypothetical protein
MTGATKLPRVKDMSRPRRRYLRASLSQIMQSELIGEILDATRKCAV